MPEGYGVGNNCLFVFDFLKSSIIGQTPPQIIRSGARQFNTKIRPTKDNYTNVMENLVLSHRLTERLFAAHNAISIIVLVKIRIEVINHEGFQYMHNVERKCHLTKYGCIPFTPYSSIWMRQCQVYHSIIRYHAGNIRN